MARGYGYGAWHHPVSEPVTDPFAPRNGDLHADRPQADRPGEPATGERPAEPAANARSIAGIVSRPVHIKIPKLGSDPSTAEVVQIAIASAISTFFEHDEPAARGDTRGIHQARVGLRRLRSHLRTFRRVIDTEWAAALSAEAAWFAESLGAMRDLDVLNGRLVQGAMLQVPEHAPAIAGLVAMIDDEHDDALNRHRQLRATARFTGLAVRLEEAAHDMPSRGRADDPAEMLLPRMLQRTWHDLRNAARLAREGSHHRALAQREDPLEADALRVRSGDIRARRGSQDVRRGRPRRSRSVSVNGTTSVRHATGCIAQPRGMPALSEVALRLATLENRAADLAAKRWDSEFRDVKKGWKKLASESRKNR